MLFGPSMLEVMIQRLTTQAASIVGIVGTSVHDEDLVARAFKASAEANSINPEDSLLKLSGRLEPYGTEGGPSSFSTPICDLILSVFELDQQNNWFRRQATVIILQQVLGGTIERWGKDISRKAAVAEWIIVNFVKRFED
jgi:sorting nexin-25